MIEEGSVLDAVTAAHSYSKIAIAHALTREATCQALAVGIDGLAHLFLDTPADGGPDETWIAERAKRGVFVTPVYA